jgi:hypothetical protein
VPLERAAGCRYALQHQAESEAPSLICHTHPSATLADALFPEPPANLPEVVANLAMSVTFAEFQKVEPPGRRNSAILRNFKSPAWRLARSLPW